jgi:hypothetical protein
MLFIRGCLLKQCLFCVLGIVAATLILGGCQSQSLGPKPPAQVKLGFSLQSTDLASLVRSVRLTILYPDSVDVREMTLVNGQIHDTIIVIPADPIVFTLEAFDSTHILLYSGSATRSVAPGQQVEVSILLLPNPDLLMLRVGPLFQSTLLQTDNLISVYVDIHNVDSLFGAAFRLRYDTLRLRFSHAEEGGFVRGTPAEPTIAGVLKDTLGYVAYFVSRLGKNELPVSGVSGFGRLATFSFAKRDTGTSVLTIDPETVSLTKPNGRLVDHFTTLVREAATVEIR